MMQNTLLSNTDLLPLTCSRAGTCCHGNKVMLNPWELAYMAYQKNMSVDEFRALHTDGGGTQMLFAGALGFKGKKACNLYVEGQGCSIHVARPLACRLFPLGRQIQNGAVVYMHQGTVFPCLEGCHEVMNLPYCTVGEYLEGQQCSSWEVAQQAYLELMQQLADIAFELLLEGGLAASGDKRTLQQWRLMANEKATQLAERIGQEWLNRLTIAELVLNETDPQAFCEQHAQLLQQQLQALLGDAQTLEALHKMAVLVMALALLLAVGVGANHTALAEHWITIAKENGAEE